jgi:hypothetical protein
MLMLRVGTWLGLSLGVWLGLSLDVIMPGLSLRLLVLGWKEGTMFQPLLGLLVGLLTGTELILGLRLAWSWNKTPAVSAAKRQAAQYGPAVTDVGPDVIRQAVPLKVDPKLAESGNLVRQSQRSWLNKEASANMNCKAVSF